MQIVLEKDEFLKAFENLFELGTCAVHVRQKKKLRH